MTATLAILWTIGEEVHTGRLTLVRDHLDLRSRRHTLSIPFEEIIRFSIDRGPAVRLRRLPALRIEVAGGLVVRIASLEGTAALTDLAEELAGRIAALA